MGTTHFSAIKTTGNAEVGGDLNVSGDQSFSGDQLLASGRKLKFGDANTYLTRGTSDFSQVTDKNHKTSATGVVERKGAEDYTGVDETADGTIPDKAACEIDASGDLVVGTVDSKTIAGLNKTGAQVAATDSMVLGVKGYMKGIADSRVEGGSLLKCGSGGRLLKFVTNTLSGSEIKNAITGGNFQNQPAGDAVEVLSDDAGDTTQTVTIYGTRNGQGDTVFSEDVSLNGTNVVTTTITDWAKILGVEMDATAAGTVTIREASGDAVIITITTGNTSAGIVIPASDNQRAYNVKPVGVANGAATQQLGIIGKATDYSSAMDSHALDGTNDVTFNSAFNLVEKILVGDVPDTVQVSVKVGAADNFEKLVGRAGPAGASARDDDLMVII